MPFANQTHLVRAATAVDDLLAQLTGDHWLAPTPCAGWSVADVIEHLVEGNLMFARHLQPSVAENATGTGISGDLLGSYRYSAETLQQALARRGDSAGTFPAQLRSRLALRVADLLVHGWDVAVATGIPLHPPEDLCAEALTFAQSRSAALERSGQFAPSQPVDEHAPAIDRLAALSGRTPPGRPGDLW
jgi:uncharacterized protein (TIGR03086 family)